MLKFTGLVQFVKDEVRDLPVKGKDGNPTGEMKPHRILEIMMLIPQPDKSQRVIVVKGFDSKVEAPKTGETWTTPEVRRYDATVEACPTVMIQ
jgi:hypothetical protein